MTTTDDLEMLLCEPAFFSIDYEINPWMDVNDPVDEERAWRQWRRLCDTLVDLGVTVHLVEPVEGLPDMVFTGDAGIVLGKRFVMSNFRPLERRPEAEHFRRWFADRGYAVDRLPSEVFFEGLGDVVIEGRSAIAAHGQRTSLSALSHIRSKFPELEWIAELELVSPLYFHLGVSLSLLDSRTGLYVAEAFSEESRLAIQRLPHHMIPVSDEDARAFALNAIVVGRNLVVNHCTDELRGDLERRDFNVIVCDVSEFLKSGGGTRCLVLPFAR